MKNIILMFCLMYQVHFITTVPLGNEYEQVHRKNGSLEKMVHIINSDTKKIAQYEENLEHIVSTAKDSINESLQQLKQFIEESRIELSYHGVDIDICWIQNSDMTHNRIDDLEKCRSQNGPIELQKKLADLKRFCGLNSDLPIDNCSNAEIDVLVESISSFHAKVSSVLLKASENCFQCVQATLSMLDVDLDSVAHEFKRCIDRYID